MITANYPKFYSLVGNQNQLVLTSDEYENVAPVHAVIDLVFSSIPVDDDTLEFTYNNGQSVFTITFKTSPPPNMFRFGTPASGSVIDFLLDYFLPNLNQNLLILDQWSWELIEPATVRFTALRPGPEWEFSVAANALASASVQTSGVSPVYLENLSMYLRLNYRPGGSPDWKYREYQVPTNQGRVTFFLNKLLSQADSIAPLPGFNRQTVLDSTSAIIEYQMQFTETFAAQLGAGNKLTSSGVFRFFPGGVTETDFAKLDLENSFDINRGWLTALQDPILMVPGQHFYLSYFYNDQTTDAHFRLELFYADGSSEFANLHTHKTLQQNHAYTVPVHHAQVAALADAQKQLLRFNVFWVQSADVNSPISSKLSFSIFQKNFTELTQLLYRNSYGFYEVAAFTGDASESFGFETAEISLALPADYQPSDRSGKNMNSRYRLEKTIQTGFRSKKAVHNLLDLIRSEDVRLVTEEAYLPKIIRVSDQELHNTLSGRQNALTLQILGMSNQKYYSNGRHTV